jgi:adenylate kinase
LIQRDDDNEESVNNRLDVFEDNTAPVIDHYSDREAFVEIDGEQTPDGVWADIEAAIDERV